jgi:DNA-directed RNA polymerase subunit beta'
MDRPHVHGEFQRADVPLGCEPPDPTACLGLYLATRTLPGARLRAFRDRERVLEALARGALAIDDTIRVDGRPDTVGRYLVLQCLPAAYRDHHDAPWDRIRVVQVLSHITRDLHVELAARCATALAQLGRYVAERSGFSLAIADFAPGFHTDDLLASAWSDVAAREDAYQQGLTTDGERYNRVQETWQLTTARARIEARRHAPILDPLAAYAASVPYSSAPEYLRTMIGPIQRRSSGLYERPVLGTLASGLDVHEYFMCCLVADEARCNIAQRTRVAAGLCETLQVALGDVTIVARDCGTTTGVAVRALLDEQTVVASLGQRAQGHVVVEAVTAPSGELIAPAGALVTSALADRIDATGVFVVVVRDVLACQAEGGVCSRCFGLAPEDAIWPAVGDDVGARAAQAIAHEARRFADHYFHICRRPMQTIGGGTVKYVGIASVPCPDAPNALGECVRDGVLEVWSHGRVTETFALAAGDQLLVADSATVDAGTVLAPPAPWERALRADLPADVEAIVAWSEEALDAPADAHDTRARFASGSHPVRLVLRDRAGQALATHDLDRATIPAVASGATVRCGDRLAWIPTTCRIDSIGGLGELIAFLEARPIGSSRAVIAPCDGTIEALDKATATLRARDGRILRLRLPCGRHVSVRVGDQLRAGGLVIHGERSHHALLHAWGEARLADHIVGELELEAARRGLAVPRVYWALAVRAMLGSRRIRDRGDTALRTGKIVSRDELEHAQRGVRAHGGRIATAVTVLRGLRVDARSKRSSAITR